MPQLGGIVSKVTVSAFGVIEISYGLRSCARKGTHPNKGTSVHQLSAGSHSITSCSAQGQPLHLQQATFTHPLHTIPLVLSHDSLTHGKSAAHLPRKLSSAQ